MTIAHLNSKDERPFDRAIRIMRAPSQMEIICIDITNRCNLACSNCTRLLENQDGYWDMTLENFRTAVRSLHDFKGIVAVLGGNPCLHREFEEICKIIKEEIPDKERRGLWTNNAYKHQDIILDTFGSFNLNPHNDDKGVMSLKELHKKSGGKGLLWEGNSEHAPLLVAIKDLYGEKEMWARISQCDVNRYWSATIIQNQGDLRAYFCEVAASFDLARGTDFGMDVTPGWWKKPLRDFSPQVRQFCPGCGAAARLKPSLDKEELDTFSPSNSDIVELAQSKGRKVELITNESQHKAEKSITEYNQVVSSLEKDGVFSAKFAYKTTRRTISLVLNKTIGRKNVVRLRAFLLSSLRK